MNDTQRFFRTRSPRGGDGTGPFAGADIRVKRNYVRQDAGKVVPPVGN